MPEKADLPATPAKVRDQINRALCQYYEANDRLNIVAHQLTDLVLAAEKAALRAEIQGQVPGPDPGTWVSDPNAPYVILSSTATAVSKVSFQATQMQDTLLGLTSDVARLVATMTDASHLAEVISTAQTGALLRATLPRN